MKRARSFHFDGQKRECQKSISEPKSDPFAGIKATCARKRRQQYGSRCQARQAKNPLFSQSLASDLNRGRALACERSSKPPQFGALNSPPKLVPTCVREKNALDFSSYRSAIGIPLLTM